VRHEAELLGSRTVWWVYEAADGHADADTDAGDIVGAEAAARADGADAAARPGTDVVFVHGFRGDHHGLEPIAARLQGVRVIAPDLPGFGESTPMAGAAHDVDGYGRWLAAFLAHTGLGGRAVVLGHSFGSIVVAHAAAAERVTAPALVLVNPIGAPALQGPRGVMTRLAVLYYRLGADLPEPIGFALLRNRAVVRLVSVTMAKTRDPELRRFIHDQHDAYFSAFADRRVVLEAFRASVSHDVSEVADRIRTPTLLVAADRDDITPIEAERELARRLPDARLVELDRVGHLVHYEKPAEAAAAITAFLAERLP